MPEDAELAFALATALLRADRLDEARDALAAVAALRPIPQTQVLIGRTLRDFGHHDLAREALAEALDRDPEVRRARYYLGTIELLAEGRARLDQAAEHFSAELLLSPDDPLTNLYLGMTEVEARRFERALGPLRIAARAEPPPVDAFHYLGRALAGLGQYAEAVAALERALSLAEEGEPPIRQLQSVHYQLAVALRSTGNADRAAHHFATAQRLATELTERDRASLADYLGDRVREERGSPSGPRLAVAPELAALRPEQRERIAADAATLLARSHFNLGVLHLRGARPARARRLLEQAEAVRPDFPDLQRTLGIVAFELGDWERARSALERARSGHPEDAVLRRLLALTRLELGDYAGSAELLEGDSERGTDPALEYAFGLALVRSDRLDRARPLFSRLLEERGDWPQLHVLLGHAHAQEGDWDEAVTAFRHALELSPEVADAHAGLGLIHLRRGELDRAEEQLRAELRLRPDDSRAAFHLATVLELSREPEEAELLLRDLLASRPQHPQARYLLGKILLGRDQAEEAIGQLEAATALAPDDPVVRYQLGLAYQRSGRPDRAAAEFERFQQLKRASRGIPP